MNKNVVGLYRTAKETVNTIDQLTAQGYSPDNLSVITKNKEKLYLEHRTGAEISPSIDMQSDTFMNKLKRFFRADMNEDFDAYKKEIDNGMFLLLIDKDASIEPVQDISLDEGLPDATSSTFASDKEELQYRNRLER